MIWTKINETAITNGTHVIAGFKTADGTKRYLLSENGRNGKQLGWFTKLSVAKAKAIKSTGQKYGG